MEVVSAGVLSMDDLVILLYCPSLCLLLFFFFFGGVQCAELWYILAVRA